MAPVPNINRTGYFRTMANVFWANFEIQNAKFRWYILKKQFEVADV